MLMFGMTNTPRRTVRHVSQHPRLRRRLPHAERALDEAIDLAVAGHGRLTILTSIPRPPYWACSPVTVAGIEPLAADLEREARTALRRATERVPDSVPVTTILPSSRSARP